MSAQSAHIFLAISRGGIHHNCITRELKKKLFTKRWDILFAVKACEWHLDSCFPNEELKEQSAFDSEILGSALNFEHGINNVTSLREQFPVLLDRQEKF